MWTEVIFSRDDLARLLEQAFPLTIHLGDPESEHSLSLTDLGEVRIVADVGLRVVCKARVCWPLLGIHVPLALSSLTLVLIPTIEPAADGDALVFRGSIEHADFSALPALIDQQITAAVNTRLAAKGAAIAWNFSKALTYLARLPGLLETLESFAIRPAWAKVRITDDAIVYAASFHSAFVRRGEAPPFCVAPPAVPRKSLPALLAVRSPPGPREIVSKHLVAAVALVLAACAGYLVFRRPMREWHAR